MSSNVRQAAGERSQPAPPSSTSSTSAFSITCSLLSQYLKEKKGGGGLVGDLGIGIGARPAPTYHDALAATALGISQLSRPPPPTTLNLLPGATTDETDTNGGTIAFSDLPFAEKTQAREPEKAQLTIFYAGKVLVFDNFPADKANDLMQFAGKGAAVADRHKPVYESIIIPTSATAENQPAAAGQYSLRSKASLRRFFEKRKHRIDAKAPYPVSDSPALASKPGKDSMAWIGLGSPETSTKLGFSLERGR